MLLLAVGVAVTAITTRNRLSRRPGTRPIAPMLVARYAALGRASSLGGSLVAGFYAGFSVWTFGEREVLPAARTDLVVGLVTASLGLLLVAAALLLERVCRVPGPPRGGG